MRQYKENFIIFLMAQKALQIQKQRQIQKISQRQIHALKLLAMSSDDLTEEIYKAVSENPALEITYDPNFEGQKSGGKESAEKLQQALENTEERSETLQEHLLHQLNSMNLGFDEMELSKKLIYNLDKNGCYGSSIAPQNLLDKTRPMQTVQLLQKCMERIHQMDPVGTCCRTLEESLFVQAKIKGSAPPLALFILDGNLEFMNPPEAGKILKKLTAYKNDWHKKSFAPKIILDEIELSETVVQDALDFILSLNPHPALGYERDLNSNYEKPDVVLIVEKKNGFVAENDFANGIVRGDENFHFQVKYASGNIPQIKISETFTLDKENIARAKEFIESLLFRESTIALQGCAIVNEQRSFFLKGPEHLKALTRHKVAQSIGVSDSTVSRTAAKNSSKYIQTEFGLFPASYFFPSGIKSKNGKSTISSEKIKLKMIKILENPENENLSDSQICEILNKKGADISRRTVAKYRAELGFKNSYKRK